MLQELKDRAQVVVKEDAKQMETGIFKTIEDLNQAGMVSAAANLRKEYHARIKRARISEFGYKIIKASDVEKFQKRIAQPALRGKVAIDSKMCKNFVEIEDGKLKRAKFKRGAWAFCEECGIQKVDRRKYKKPRKVKCNVNQWV